MRESLPSERSSMTRRFNLKYMETDETNGNETMKDLSFYLTAGMYPDGRLGEVFIRGEKMGGLISGSLDSMSMMLSVALQHGVPMEAMTSKLRSCKFGPSGRTGDPEFRTCTSVFDLIAQWLERTFPNGIFKDQPDAKLSEKAQGTEHESDPGNLVSIAG